MNRLKLLSLIAVTVMVAILPTARVVAQAAPPAPPADQKISALTPAPRSGEEWWMTRNAEKIEELKKATSNS